MPRLSQMQELKTTQQLQTELIAHERECAERAKSVQEKLQGLDKRLWRLEAMIMASTIAMITLCINVFIKF
tara:strand:- start:2180 stop:2392 length:213 start_codon:yes stop_codon:yes gene_type:complete